MGESYCHAGDVNNEYTYIINIQIELIFAFTKQVNVNGSSPGEFCD